MTYKTTTVVTLYVVPDCPLCERARDWLTKHQIIYVERDVAKSFGAFRAMYELTQQRLVPVFEVEGKALVRPREDQLIEFLR
ncbi:MAG TPA: glutaredoxin family protein [Pyrinomonadaceae bacterium]|jgi:glutaredoxin|nr:glutaredoxin family protein [Pyrinomonadaceae bacterium]